VVSVAAASPAEQAGLAIGDEIVSIDGRVPRDVIEYHLLTDEADPEFHIRRGHEEFEIEVQKDAGEPVGLEVSSAVFDRVRTCDNHCDFCFIYQLPKGMRRSLYLKDDDYRLSFLYGNFTTLTRFTELDLERVIDERLSPLFVSIHSTDPLLRARLVSNRRGATSLRWLRAILDGGIEVHGQVVVCPGVNDGSALEDTMAGIADQFPELASVALVPIGVSRYSTAPDMRPHTADEARAVIDLVDTWQQLFMSMIGRRMVHASDEFYLLAERDFPQASEYEAFEQHENGVGMSRALELSFNGDEDAAIGKKSGFFSWVDGAPASGYRAVRSVGEVDASDNASDTSVTVVTGEYGAMVLEPLIRDFPGVDLLAVKNDFFGGNIAVSGLLVGQDIAAALNERKPQGRVLLPDVCLSEGLFLDGTTLSDLPIEVEVVPTDGISLRKALLTHDKTALVTHDKSENEELDELDRVPVTMGSRR
jgi:putative radical SAM enzyme (TIGR03279 family)